MTVALNKGCGLLLKTLGLYRLLTALTKHTRLLPNALGSFKVHSALNQILTARTIYSKILPDNLGSYKAFLAFAKYSRLSVNTLGHFQPVTYLTKYSYPLPTFKSLTKYSRLLPNTRGSYPVSLGLIKYSRLLPNTLDSYHLL